MTIKDLIKNFTDTAKSKNIPLYYDNEYGVDADIFNWLPNATVSDKSSPIGNWKQVDTKNGTSENTMLETAVKMLLSQAIIKFTEMVKNGEFDKKETCRIIFLTETSDGNPIKLICLRDSDGRLNLYVSVACPYFMWSDTGLAWFSSNNTLETSELSLDTQTLEAISLLKKQGYKITKEF